MYATKPQTLEELRDQIEHVINDIPLATMQTVCRSVRRRCWECTVAESGHFEHIQTVCHSVVGRVLWQNYELRDQIEHDINDIPLATIQMVCRSVRRRCWECTVVEGGHFEHVRD